MNIYTVIPARGGSKSIPKKNIRLLRGKPLIQYSIEYSLKCSLVTNTIVSTDSEEISEIACNCGAKVQFIRPVELAQDDTPDYPVIRHALDTLENLNNEKIDAIVLLRPTSPLRPPNLIERGVDILKQFSDVTSVRSVTLAKEHPYRQWIMYDNYMKGYETKVFETYNFPRQKLPEAYFQTGDLEIVRRRTLLGGSVSGQKVAPLIIDRSEMLDIDEPSDLKLAEKKLHQ